MPQLIFKGIKATDVQQLSQDIISELSRITETPEDHFLIECPDHHYFDHGKLSNGYPIVEIIQYNRGKEIESQMADIIGKAIKKLSYCECEVYFTHIPKENYYIL